ncbi:MAG: TlpA family protein disulfide reductase [Elusimicrobiota bacterium]
MPIRALALTLTLALPSTALAAAAPADCRPVSVPDFSAKDFRSGKDVRFSDLRGRPIVMNLWFASCPTCRTEAPAFQKLAEDNPDIAVVSLTNPKHSKTPAAIPQFLDQYRWTFPTLLDEGDVIRDALLEKLGVDWYAYPTTYLFDKNGVLVGKLRGGVDWEKEGPAHILRDLRAGALKCFFPVDEHEACAPFNEIWKSDAWLKLNDENERSSRLCRAGAGEKLLACLNDYCDKSQADDAACANLKNRCCAASTNDGYGCGEARSFPEETKPASAKAESSAPALRQLENLSGRND